MSVRRANERAQSRAVSSVSLVHACMYVHMYGCVWLAHTCALAVSNGPATPSTPRVPSQPTTAPLIGEKLDALLHSIDPSFTLTPEAAEVLLSLADDFVEKVVEQSELVALHREKAKGGGATGGTVMGYGSEINVGDVSLILRERWGISIPGLQQQGSSVSGSSDAEIAKIFQPGGTWATGEVAGGGKKRGGGGAGKK